ncbi:MAG TPA: hypothetical protein ENJ18_12315, partial [Nannocystis exedens]|nr:hypothetical protein [Nannocystis exedens]
MPISRISVFCLAFFVNLGFSADVIAGSPPSAAAKQSGFQRAYDLFEAGDYRGAAKSFDQLFADFADETFLHYAALSWATAGDDTRAILRWRHLLADPQLASPLEKEARSYLEGAYLRTVTLSIKISPARALLPTSKIILERQEDGKSGESLSLTHKELKGAQDPDHAGFQLHVRPGIWRLRVSDVHPGYESPPVEVEAQPKVNTVDNDNSQDEVNAIDIVLVLQPRVGELQLSLDLPAQRTRPLEFVLEDAEGIEAPKQASILSEQLTQALRVGRWRYELRDPEFGVVDRGSVEIHEGETYEL